MKRLFTLSIALLFAATAFAQLSAVSGQPMPKKGAEPIVDALVTFTSEWDKDLKYQRKTDADGFRVVLPQGGYLLTIEAAATRKKEYIYQAAMLDPHTSAELSIDDIVSLCDDLIEAHKGWLPEYH